MDRKGLIEKARAFAHSMKRRGQEIDGADIAGFCLPLLAAERERAIEECARLVLSARVSQAWKLWKVGGVREAELARADAFDDAMRYEIRDAIRALNRTRQDAEPDGPRDRPAGSIHAGKRAPEKLEPGADNARGIVTAAYPVAQQCDVKPEGAGSTPAPERLPDWAEAVALEYLDGGVQDIGLAALLRERFGPLVEAVISLRGELEYHSTALPGSEFQRALDVVQKANEALARLRAGAKGTR